MKFEFIMPTNGNENFIGEYLDTNYPHDWGMGGGVITVSGFSSRSEAYRLALRLGGTSTHIVYNTYDPATGETIAENV